MTEKIPKLKVGRAYFMCGYYLRNSPVPEIETWIYIGKNIFDEDRTQGQPYHYFERPETYFSQKISEENRKFQTTIKMIGEEGDSSQSKMRVAATDLEALVYDYSKMREWVNALASEPNADSAF